ncbi:MAG: EthD domain-containing protein [Gammaproteobacteria bacterium]
MYKVMLFARRKAGWTPEAFRERYESGHAPLAARVLKGLRRYTRNYIGKTSEGFAPDFDVITEFWWEDYAAWKAFREFYATPAGRILIDDEAVFMDRDSMRVAIVGECESAL